MYRRCFVHLEKRGPTKSDSKRRLTHRIGRCKEYDYGIEHEARGNKFKFSRIRMNE